VLHRSPLHTCDAAILPYPVASLELAGNRLRLRLNQDTVVWRLGLHHIKRRS
jgi:hypothetical protein